MYVCMRLTLAKIQHFSALHEKLDLHKFARCKYGAKKCKLGGKLKAKMVNIAFAYQFTWGCKF